MDTAQIHRTHLANAAALITALVTAFAALCTGCSRHESGSAVVASAVAQTAESSARPAGSVEVFDAKTGPMRREVELSGTVEGYETAKLMSKVDGYVGEVAVNIGDRVRRGDLLAQLDLPELGDEVERQRRLVEQAEALIRSRKADVDLAKAKRAEHNARLRMEQSEQERAKRLVSRGSLTQQQLDEESYDVEVVIALKSSADAKIAATKAQLDSAYAALNVAKADVRKAESMARYAKITAPFDGLITERMIDSGAFVRPASTGAGTSLFTITRVDKVRVVAFLPMDEAGLLDVGDRVEVRSVQSLPDLHLGDIKLTVSRIARSFDTDSRMMRAEVDVDNDHVEQTSRSILTPGDYVRLAVVLSAIENEIVVPNTAVGKDTRGPFVSLVNADNRCVRVPVKVLQRQGATVAIQSPDVSAGSTLLAKAHEVDDDTQLSLDQLIRQ